MNEKATVENIAKFPKSFKKKIQSPSDLKVIMMQIIYEINNK